MSQAEAVSGIPKDFQQWAKKQGCTAFKASRVFIAPLQEFFKDHGEEWEGLDGDGTTEAVNRQRIVLMKKQERKLDREHQVAMETLVSKEAVKAQTAVIISKILFILKSSLSRHEFNQIASQFQQADLSI